MNLVTHRSSSAERGDADIPALLAKWYAAHSSIRRLWAVEDPVAITVLLWLEPSSDGDDALPAWLANNHRWTNDLTVLTGREVHLKLNASTAFAEPCANADVATIAELSWRDSWTLP